MTKPVFKLLPLAALSVLLSACNDDNSSKSTPLVEGSYAVQLVASDYSSSQVAVGNILGDRTATQGLLAQSQSGYTISTWGSQLYHIGQYYIDTISRYDTVAATAFDEALWTYSTNDVGDSSANAYQLVQTAEDNGYLIRYGSGIIWQVDPSASSEDNFIKGRIDLSAYAWDDSSMPGMADAVVVGDYLLVAMQRWGSDWNVHEGYVAVIDLTTNEEVDTDPQTDGLNGILLNVTNANNLVALNGKVYVSGRGDYGSVTGGVDVIDTSSWEASTLLATNALADLSDADNSTWYHIKDVAVTADQQLYVTANIEQGYSTLSTHILQIDANTGAATDLDLHTLTGIAASVALKIGDINIDSNNRLWAAITNSDTPALMVIDTDTNSLSGELITLDMPASRIEFLDIE